MFFPNLQETLKDGNILKYINKFSKTGLLLSGFFLFPGISLFFLFHPTGYPGPEHEPWLRFDVCTSSGLSA